MKKTLRYCCRVNKEGELNWEVTEQTDILLNCCWLGLIHNWQERDDSMGTYLFLEWDCETGEIYVPTAAE